MRADVLFWATTLTIGWAGLMSERAAGHGGVVMEEDECVINIGFYKAHFTVYQPETRGNEEFCEDLPDRGETIFVLDYLHRSMKEVPVDFRIIKDVTELGRFAQWRDVQAIEDIEAHTVFYQRPAVHVSENLTVEHLFAEEGDYIGIVTARHPTEPRSFNAVFPFRVGDKGFSYFALFAAIIVLLQIQFLISTGGLKRLRRAVGWKTPGEG